MDTAILDKAYRYWFGDLAGREDFPAERSKIWFRPTPEIDDEIRQAFGPAIPAAAAAEWDLSALSREQQIGLVVLLDQFPRNIFRESGESFAYDAAARRIAAALTADGGIDRFRFVERSFLLLPFEHSEDVADQDRAVLLAAQLAVDAPAALRDFARTILDYATKHRDLIRKFGRFPHRNALLGRTATAEEEAFLKEHGRGF